MTLKNGRKVIRFRCSLCNCSFRARSNFQKSETRGRKSRLASIEADEFQNIFNYGFIEIVKKYQLLSKESFFKSAVELSGVKRTSLSRYLNEDTSNIDLNFLILVFNKVKFAVQQIEDLGKRKLFFEKVSQECAEILVKCNTRDLEKDTFNCQNYLREIEF